MNSICFLLVRVKGETKEQNITSIMEKTDIKDKKNFEIEKSKKQESIFFIRLITFIIKEFIFKFTHFRR